MAKPKTTAAPRKREKTLVRDRITHILGSDGHGWKRQYNEIRKASGDTDAESWLDSHCAQVAWARSVLRSDPRWHPFVDTETTGRDESASIVDIAIVWHTGHVLLDTFVAGDTPMTAKSSEITGITDADLVGAPTFAEIAPRIRDAFEGAKAMIAYNAAFDQRVIEQSAFFADFVDLQVPPILAPDVMERFARWVGDWDPYWVHYKWHKLEAGHRARGDALAMVEMVKAMAASQAIEDR